MAAYDVNALVEHIRGKVLMDEPMARHTSFRIGGPADLFVVPDDIESLRTLLARSAGMGVPVYIVGSGTNLLVRDEGIHGVVVGLGGFLKTRWQEGSDGATVWAGSGVVLASLMAESARRGMSGLEPLAGIPGTVGGAVSMNAGTQAGCIADVVDEVEVMSMNGEEVMTVSKGAAGFRYRGSGFEDMVVLGASFWLSKSTPDKVRAAVDAVRALRKGQPTGLPCAGSIFRNPPGDFAGRLVEAAGCKGERIGGAVVSEVHGNFIVNAGGATAYDVIRLIGQVQQRVLESTGIALELEVKVI